MSDSDTEFCVYKFEAVNSPDEDGSGGVGGISPTANHLDGGAEMYCTIVY